MEEYDHMIADSVYAPHVGQVLLNVNLTGSKLALQIKRKPDGSIDKYKARLIAMVNPQKADSYKDISSAIPRTTSAKKLKSN